MKIVDVRAIPLRGATHDTGWPGGTDPNEQMNTLIEVVADSGLIGIGSCFTNRVFVEASLTHLKPMLVGEKAPPVDNEYDAQIQLGLPDLKVLRKDRGGG